MLQAILDGQRAIKEEIKGDIDNLRKDVKALKEGLNKTEVRLTERIDRLGIQIARLEDDAPTIEEFEDLKNEVAIIQKHLAIS